MSEYIEEIRELIEKAQCYEEEITYCHIQAQKHIRNARALIDEEQKKVELKERIAHRVVASNEYNAQIRACRLVDKREKEAHLKSDEIEGAKWVAITKDTIPPTEGFYWFSGDLYPDDCVVGEFSECLASPQMCVYIGERCMLWEDVRLEYPWIYTERIKAPAPKTT